MLDSLGGEIMINQLISENLSWLIPLLTLLGGWAIKGFLDARFKQLSEQNTRQYDRLNDIFIKMSGDIGELKGGKADKPNAVKT